MPEKRDPQDLARMRKMFRADADRFLDAYDAFLKVGDVANAAVIVSLLRMTSYMLAAIEIYGAARGL